MAPPNRTLQAAATELEQNFKDVNERIILLNDLRKEVKRLEEVQYEAQRRRRDLRVEIDYIINHYKVNGFLGVPPEPLPIRALLYCPKGHKHVDKDEWATKLHRTHRCEKCNNEWQPLDGYTVGVENL